MQRRSRPLGKPFRTPGQRKKFAVYVKDPKTGRIKLVRFGDPGLKIKQTDPARRKNFRARHRCDQQTNRLSPAYWSCRWGWPKAGKPRLQASAAIADTIGTGFKQKKTTTSGIVKMNERQFYIKTGERSVIFTARQHLPVLITGPRLSADRYFIVENRYVDTVRQLTSPDVYVVIAPGKLTGTVNIFGITLAEGAAPSSTDKADWNRATPIIPAWIEPDLVPIKLGSCLLGLSVHNYVTITGESEIYQVTDCSDTGCKITNFVALQTSMLPIGEFTTRSRTRHLLFATQVTQQTIGPPGLNENVTELTVYISSRDADKVASQLKGRYEILVTPQLGNNLLVQVVPPNFDASTNTQISYNGLNVPRPNTCPLLLYRRISNQRGTMRFVQGVLDSEVTSLVKIGGS